MNEKTLRNNLKIVSGWNNRAVDFVLERYNDPDDTFLTQQDRYTLERIDNHPNSEIQLPYGTEDKPGLLYRITSQFDLTDHPIISMKEVIFRGRNAKVKARPKRKLRR